MRNAISIDAPDNYVDIFNAFEEKYEEKRKALSKNDGIVDIDDIILKTNELVDENFLSNADFGSTETVGSSIRLRTWENIINNKDAVIEAIDSYAELLVPTHESGYYDSALDREKAVEGLSKVVINAISLYTNEGAGDYNSFINIGTEEKSLNSGFDKNQNIYNSILHDHDLESGLESYGTGTQNFGFDLRSSIMISASNYLTSIEDKLFARTQTPKSKIEFVADNIIKYDWAKGKSKVTTGPNARGTDNEIGYVLLNKDPSSISTKSRPVEFHNTSAVDGLYSTGTFIAANKDINIFEVVQKGVPDDDPVYHAFGESDTLSDGVKLKNIYLKISRPVTVGSVTTKHTRLHKIDVSYRDDCYFTKAENITEQNDRVLNMFIKGLVVTDDDKIDEHRVLTTDPLGTLDSGSYIALDCHVAGRINVRTSQLEVTVSNTSYKIKRNDTGKDSTETADVALKGFIDDATNGEFEVVAYEIDAQYTEENIRKSNVAIRRNKVTKTTRVPSGRTYIFETQALPKQRTLNDLITNCRNIIGLGNLYKLLTVWEDFVVNVGKAYRRDKFRNDTSPYTNFVSNFVTHNTILPSIETLDVDFTKGNIQYSRDHELVEDTFGMFIRILHSFLCEMMSDSSYPIILNSGEKARFVAVTHDTVIDTILNPVLTNDTKKTFIRSSGNGIVILELGRHIEIEFHGLPFDSFKKKMLMAPVRTGNRSHASSFGQILDVGLYSGSYTTGDSSVSEKHIVNSREGFFVTTPIGALVNLNNFNSVYPSQI